ncbi:hypothetical protein [Acuticoccus mangrovi]|uniref:hypothetical protein n=1 Tax=Acuticoccus mangrovi TaxID=2796142 RepID=UPI001B3B6055|nr:hypothetical protein [Acuticoccus mangrovi]
MTTPIPATTPRLDGGPLHTSCILALDLGTTTGWAIRGHDGLITSGSASFRPGRFDGGGMRFLRFTNWLTEIERLSGPIAAIWFEEVRRHTGADAAHVFGGLMATFTAWAEMRGVPYAAAIIASFVALPLPVAWRFSVPTGTPWYGIDRCSHQADSVARKPP